MPLKWTFTIPEKDIEGVHSVDYENFIISGIPKDLTGKTVLDLAAWGGYYSYIAKKRGAETVVAIDSCEAEKRVFNSSVENVYKKYKILDDTIKFIPMDVMDMDRIRMEFDIIFCFGIYYHLKDMYSFFEKCYSKCKEMIIIEGIYDERMRLSNCYLNAEYELNDDPTNYWSPSEECLQKMLRRIGFKNIEIVGTWGDRVLLIARK